MNRDIDRDIMNGSAGGTVPPENVDNAKEVSADAAADRKPAGTGKEPGTEMTGEENARAVAVSRLRVFLGAAVALTVIAALLRILALAFAYDPEPGYFRGGALPAVANALTVIAVLICLSTLFLFPKNSPKGALNDGGAPYFVSVFAAFVLIADFGYRAIRFTDAAYRAEFAYLFTGGSGSSNTRILRITGVITLLIMLSSLASAVSFFLRADGRKREKAAGGGMRNARILFGLAPPVRAVCGMTLLYFDMTSVMNGANRMISELALIAAMLFLLFEDRFEISDSGDRVRPRQYIAAGLCTVVLCGVTGISVGVGYFMGVTGDGELCFEALFETVCAAYAAVRLAYLYKEVPNAAAAEATEAAEAAEAAEVAKAAESAEAADNAEAAEAAGAAAADNLTQDTAGERPEAGK